MIADFDILQENFSIDILTALKSSLKYRRKHVLRSLQLSKWRPGLMILSERNFVLVLWIHEKSCCF